MGIVRYDSIPSAALHHPSNKHVKTPPGNAVTKRTKRASLGKNETGKHGEEEDEIDGGY